MNTHSVIAVTTVFRNFIEHKLTINNKIRCAQAIKARTGGDASCAYPYCSFVILEDKITVGFRTLLKIIFIPSCKNKTGI